MTVVLLVVVELVGLLKNMTRVVRVLRSCRVGGERGELFRVLRWCYVRAPAEFVWKDVTHSYNLESRVPW